MFYRPCGPWPLFQFLICTQSVGLLGRGSARRKTTTYAQNKRTHTFIPLVVFESKLPVFGLANEVHALDSTAKESVQFLTIKVINVEVKTKMRFCTIGSMCEMHETGSLC
jgi:hypothetical protein